MRQPCKLILPGEVSDLTPALAADFALLYPPYNDARCPSGACRRAKPLCVASIPHEWGIKGG